jgi:hypothetical protein
MATEAIRKSEALMPDNEDVRVRYLLQILDEIRNPETARTKMRELAATALGQPEGKGEH